MTQGTVRIDAYEARTGDKSVLAGHTYSDKAPGTAAIALPGFLVALSVLEVAGIPLGGDRGWLFSSWIAAALSVGLLVAAGISALFLLFRRWMPAPVALVAALGVAFSMPFPYATMLMSHGATFGLLAIALWAVLGDPATPAWRQVLAGAASGLAMAGEYTAAIGAAGVLFLVARRGGLPAARFVLGAIPPLLLVPLYGLIAFGSPLEIGYSHLTGWEGMEQGFFGISLQPRLDVVVQLLFGQFRGLFFWSPFLLLALVGYPLLWRRDRALFWVTIAVPAVQVLLISSFPYWNGGGAIGPRHLMGAVPFLAVAAAHGVSRLPRTGAALALLSAALVGTATFVYALPEPWRHDLVGYYIELVGDGRMTWNLGKVLGMPGYWSALPLVLGVSAGARHGTSVGGEASERISGIGLGVRGKRKADRLTRQPASRRPRGSSRGLRS